MHGVHGEMHACMGCMVWCMHARAAWCGACMPWYLVLYMHAWVHVVINACMDASLRR